MNDLCRFTAQIYKRYTNYTNKNTPEPFQAGGSNKNPRKASLQTPVLLFQFYDSTIKS